MWRGEPGYPLLADNIKDLPSTEVEVATIVADAEARAVRRGSDMVTCTDLLAALSDAGSIPTHVMERIAGHEYSTLVNETLDRVDPVVAAAAHLECLPRRQAAFTALRYGLGGKPPLRVAQVAERFELSREAGRMILTGAEESIGVAALRRAGGLSSGPE